MPVFVIDDELHAEQTTDFDSFDDAMDQLKAWSTIPWDQPPNRAPCTSWRGCGREYAIIDTATGSRTVVLKLSKSGVEWVPQSG